MSAGGETRPGVPVTELVHGLCLYGDVGVTFHVVPGPTAASTPGNSLYEVSRHPALATLDAAARESASRYYKGFVESCGELSDTVQLCPGSLFTTQTLTIAPATSSVRSSRDGWVRLPPALTELCSNVAGGAVELRAAQG